MTPAAPLTSARLRRAAEAERADLDRYRDRLECERLRLRDELARIEAGLADVAERQLLLDRISPRAQALDLDEAGGRLTVTKNPNGSNLSADPNGPRSPSANGVDGSGADSDLLRGPAIREAAVQLLRDDPRGTEALHYRDWYSRLTDAGLAVAGKDPLAVFLTQITRSPVVRKSTQAGVYELDRGAPARLRGRLAQLHEELRQLATAPAATADLSAIRARRDELNSEIGQTEKALFEASSLLDVDKHAALAS